MKTVICLSGLSGSGKSSIANKLAIAYKYPVLEVSDIVQAINKDGTKLINDERVWNNLKRKIKSILLVKEGVIINGVREDYIIYNLKNLKHNFISFAIVVDKKTREARMLQRGMTHNEIAKKHVQDDKIGTLDAMYVCDYVISNEQDLKKTVQQIKMLINNKR